MLISGVAWLCMAAKGVPACTCVRRVQHCAAQGNAYQPFGKGPREVKAAVSPAQELQAPTGVDSMPKRQTPPARGISINRAL